MKPSKRLERAVSKSPIERSCYRAPSEPDWDAYVAHLATMNKVDLLDEREYQRDSLRQRESEGILYAHSQYLARLRLVERALLALASRQLNDSTSATSKPRPEMRIDYGPNGEVVRTWRKAAK